MAGKGKPAAPANETKNEKFRRLATTRSNVALKGIASLGGLASSGYEFSAAEVGAIEALILTNLKNVMDKFAVALQPKTKGEAGIKEKVLVDPFASLETPAAETETK